MRYRYALSPLGAVLDIVSVAAGGRSANLGARCFGCGNDLVAVLGQRRQAHFRHKVDQACSRETYLHALAKRTVIEAFWDAKQSGRAYSLTLPVKRLCRRWQPELGYVCERSDGVKTFNLVALFDVVDAEAPVGGFVADVLLRSSRTDEKLLVELAVTHRCEPAKLASGLRIVEVLISMEEDLLQLRTGLDARTPSVSAYNLKEPPPITDNCSGRCGQEISAFHVYESGKSRIETGPPQRIANERRKAATVYTQLLHDAESGSAAPLLLGEDYRREAERAYRAGVKIRCCALCRYAGFRTWEKPVFCKLKRHEVGHNEAAICEAYRPEIQS